jgi:hypothetical protein
VYEHDPSISIEIGRGDSSWNVSLLLRAEKKAAFLRRQWGFKLDRQRINEYCAPSADRTPILNITLRTFY